MSGFDFGEYEIVTSELELAFGPNDYARLPEAFKMRKQDILESQAPLDIINTQIITRVKQKLSFQSYFVDSLREECESKPDLLAAVLLLKLFPNVQLTNIEVVDYFYALKFLTKK